MKPVQIIPCLDIKDGRVVKGIEFVGLRDAGDPVEHALRYSQEGADLLVLLDISATVEGRQTSLDVLRRVRAAFAERAIALPICVGGGFSTLEGIQAAFDCGAAQVSLNSAAVRDPAFLAEACRTHPGRIVLAIDTTQHADGRRTVLISGGNEDTGMLLADWARQGMKAGAAALLVTDRTSDGVRGGYDLEGLRIAIQASKLPVIASGGAGELSHFLEAARCGASGLLAASLFHFGVLKIGDVKEYLAEQCVPVLRLPLLDMNSLRWNDAGLIPCITQDARDGHVLMMAWMNREALETTIRTGCGVYYSRSRQQLWRKGETSGHTQRVLRIDVDCDRDCLCMQVEQTGPACHTGEKSCFSETLAYTDTQPAPGSAILQTLEAVIAQRRLAPKQESYTQYLFDRGVDKICKKVAEESAELIISAKNRQPSAVSAECADLLYHVLVLLNEQGVRLEEVYAELARRG